MRINIDRDLCIGSGNCCFEAPNTFDIDDDLVAVVIDPAGDPEAKILRAEQGCPTNAITVTV